MSGWLTAAFIISGILLLLFVVSRVRLSPRLFVLLLIVLVIVTLIFLFWGNRNDSTRSFQLDLSVPTAQQLRSFFTVKYRPQEIRVAQGSEDGCQIQGRQIVVPDEVTCRFFLPASASRTKQVVLQLEEEGESVELILVQENALTIEQTLETDEVSENLDVYRNEMEQNAQLTVLNCQASAPERNEEGEEESAELLSCRLLINP